MNKKLLRQIMNEWRSNLWLMLELLVVSVVMWYIVDYLNAQYTVYSRPMGVDIEHCYKLGFGRLNPKAVDYVADRDNREAYLHDLHEFVDRLEHRPEIEAVALGQNSYPYNGSNSGISIACDTLTAGGDEGYLLRRWVTPDFVKVFRIHGAQGETPEQLAKMLADGELLVGNNVFRKKYGIDVSELKGRDFYLDGDTTNSFKLGAAVTPIKYFDYTEWDTYLIRPAAEWAMPYMNELVIRVKPEYDTPDFADRFMSDVERRHTVGVCYIGNITSFDDIRRSYLTDSNTSLRNYLVGMGFLLLNIFLGLLGTFWFRTQQRTGEIAIRKVNGATSWCVFGRLISEGLLLLIVVTPLAFGVDAILAHLELNAWFDGTSFDWIRIVKCVLISFGLMALMIAVGIAIPAWRAMHVVPVEALHDE